MLSLNKSSALHRVFFMICMALSIWSFAFSIANSAPNYELCFFWRRLSALGWCSFYGLLLHFSLILTGKEKILKKKWIYPVLYVPSIFFIFAFCLHKELAASQYNFTETYAGWINIQSGTMWDKLFNLYYISYSLASIVLIFFWGRSTEKIAEKKQSKLIVSSFLTALIVGTLTEITINTTFDIKVPQIAPIVIMIPIVVILHCIKKYGLLPPEDKIKKADAGHIMSEHARSMLFYYISFAYVFGSFLNFATQYIIFRAPIGEVLLYSIGISFIGLVLLVVQKLKVKIIHKDIISFIIIALTYPAAIYFGYIETAAITTWSIVFLLVLVSVVFDRRDMLFIVGGISVLTLISVWIAVPSYTITISATDHISRIVILLVFIWIALYVNHLYIQRLNENENQIQIQQLQVKVSTLLDSVNEDNISRKISESLQECAEYLGANHAFILVFNKGENPENTVFEWCNKDILSMEHSISKLTISCFPVWNDKIVSGQSNGIFVEDIASLPDGINEKQFMSENGIKSTMIMPLVNKDKLIGIWGFNMIKKEKHWDMNHQNALIMIGNRITDIYLNIEAEKDLIRMAYYDSLTGLPNRIMFKESLYRAIKMAELPKYIVGIIYLNLDFFKTINDFMGHSKGDELLFEVGKRLRNVVNKEGVVSRYEGDEFLIMISQAEKGEEVISIAEEIIASLNQPIIINNQEISVSASLGVAMAPKDGNDSEELIKNAGLAMVVSKGTGKSRYTVCTPEIKEESKLDNELSNSLYRALERQEFVLYYQPMVSPSSEEIVGVEALIRWKHPQKGLISPGRFIPLAEKMGVIGSIDRWVLKTACEQNKIWQDRGFPKIKVAVNFSLSRFYQENVIEKTALLLKETGLDPKYLEVEITESIAYYKPEIIVNTLNGMKAIGISIAIDDFGMQYSSLSRLHTLPVDRIKIDRQFVLGLSKGNKGQDIMKTIFTLSKTLGLRTTVEGVETEEQLSYVREMGCDEIQGFYFYKPMPAADIEKILFRLPKDKAL